nr:hypothetical protein [uncultured Carboxylicivirga sp.]
MKYRTCPACGYQYPFYKYSIQSMFRMADASWYCPNCDAVLTFRRNNRFITIIASVLPIVLCTAGIGFLKGFGLNSMVSWMILIVLGLIWVFMVCGFEKLATINKSNKK